MITVTHVPVTTRALAEAPCRAPAWGLPADLREDRFLPTGRPTGFGGARVRPAQPAARQPRRAPRDLRRAMEGLEDLALLEAVLERRDEAFTTFYDRFRNLMIACITRVCQRVGVRLSGNDLEDVLSETALNMVAHDYRRLSLYRSDGGCSVSSWVGVIATSTAHDHLRKERRRRLDPVLDSELERVAPPVEGPDHTLIDREQREFVDAALEGFSARDRKFVELYFVEAMTPETIAETMGVSVSTVYSKKAKIKTRLRALASAAA